MTCSKELQITVAEAPQALVWWTMDLGSATAEIDSVLGLNLEDVAGGIFMATVAGKVNNALRFFVVDPAFSLVSECPPFPASSASLAFNGSAITMVAWVLTQEVNPGVDNMTSLAYTFDQGGTNYVLRIQRNGATGTGPWTAGFGPSGSVVDYSTVASIPATWSFLALRYNAITGEIALSINGGASSTQIAATPGAGANIGGRFGLASTAGPPDAPTPQQLSTFDEVALFSSFLTDGEIDFLYNSGNGRTYPP